MNSGKYGLAKNRTYEKITSSSYAISASYAITASYALTAGGGGVNPTNLSIPYNNGGTFADTNISQQSGYINIGTNTQNVLGYDGYVRIWDGNYQPTNLQAPFGNFMINQNSIYNSGDGKIRYVQNGYAQRIQLSPSAGQMVFAMGTSGSAGAVVTENIAIGIQNSGNVGIGKQYPNAKLDVSGSAIISGSLIVTGCITGSFSGSVFGYVQNSATSSFVTNTQTSSFVLNTQTGSMLSPYTLNSRTASFLTTGSQNATQTISGSLTILENLTILGSSSITFISSSTLNIGTNLITVNTINPTDRYGGIAVIDSGSSPLVSASFLYDSLQDEFIFVHKGDGTNITSSHFLVGPETYNNLGNETYIPNGTLIKSLGNEHVSSSNITDNNTTISLGRNTQITGLLTVSNGIVARSSGSLLNNSVALLTQTASISIIGPTAGGPYAAMAINTYGNTGVDIQTGINGGGSSGGVILLNRLGGSVAIGKATANSTLDVNGNTTITGSLNVSSTVTATSFVGNGSGLTGISAGGGLSRGQIVAISTGLSNLF
jgi:hypothetical protein